MSADILGPIVGVAFIAFIGVMIEARINAAVRAKERAEAALRAAQLREIEARRAAETERYLVAQAEIRRAAASAHPEDELATLARRPR